VSVVQIYSDMEGWIHLLSAIVKEDSASRQSSIGLSRYGWIHLQTTIVKEDSVSRIDLFRHGWIYLLPTIVKEDSVSHQSSRSVKFTYK
jgi:hypothetical protein